MHAQRIFTISDDEVEEILKTKVKGASKVSRSVGLSLFFFFRFEENDSTTLGRNVC